MATHGPTNLPSYFNGNADFRAWVQGIHDALTAIGLVQTADTGQIDPTTVVAPGDYAVFRGYEIWRFDDTLQADAPVYIRLDFGSSNAVANSPAIKVQVGSGTDGAGALTGQTSSVRTLNAATATSVDVLLPLYASGSSGELMLAVNVNTGATGYGMFIAVERPKDSADAPTDEGVVVHSAQSAGHYSMYVPKTGSGPSDMSLWCSLQPYFWQRAASGENADAVPVFIPLGGVWRFSRILVTHLGDFPCGGTMDCDIFGATHTYLALDDKAASPYLSNVYSGSAIRWE